MQTHLTQCSWTLGSNKIYIHILSGQCLCVQNKVSSLSVYKKAHFPLYTCAIIEDINGGLRNYNYGHLYCFPAKSLMWHLNGILIKNPDRLFGVASWKMQKIEQERIASVFWGSCGKGLHLMGTQNLSQINEVEMVIQCVIARERDWQARSSREAAELALNRQDIPFSQLSAQE